MLIKKHFCLGKHHGISLPDCQRYLLYGRGFEIRSFGGCIFASTVIYRESMGHCMFIVSLLYGCPSYYFLLVWYLFCTFINNYVVMQLLYHRGHMHFHVKRKFHEGFSLDTIIKELLWYQKKKKRAQVIVGFLQYQNKINLTFFSNFRVGAKLYNQI